MKRIAFLAALLWPISALAQDHAAHSSYGGLRHARSSPCRMLNWMICGAVRAGGWPRLPN